VASTLAIAPRFLRLSAMSRFRWRTFWRWVPWVSSWPVSLPTSAATRDHQRSAADRLATYGGTGGGLGGTLLFAVPMVLLGVLATVIVLRRSETTIAGCSWGRSSCSLLPV